MESRTTRAEVTVNRTYFVDDIHPCYELNNRTFKFTSNPSIVCVLLYVFLSSMSVVTVCGNLLVIISIIYFKQMHIPTNYLILSLAVADLLVGVIVFPLSMVFSVTSCRFQPTIFCNVRGSFDVTLSTASILNLCCISIDRYHAVCQPLIYRSKINDRVIGFMILVSWGIAGVVGIGIMIASFEQIKCGRSCMVDSVISTILACVFSFYMPVIIMLSLYLKIFLVAQRQAHTIQNSTGQTTKSGATISKMERKATKTLAIVLGVFLLCWFPFFFCLTFLTFRNVKRSLPVFETINWITLSNSMLNPFIYAFFYSWFRAAFKMIISGKIFQGNFSDSNLM